MDNFKVDLRDVMVGAEETSVETSFSSTATSVAPTPIASTSTEVTSVSVISSPAESTTPTTSTTANPGAVATSGGVSRHNKGLWPLVLSLLFFALATILPQ
jgi:hypothetical protein